MSRPLRLELAGGLYHVTSRGDGREDIYLNEADRLAWLDVLGQVCKRFNWVCHAWCQMGNHYHLLIETPEGNLGQGMRQLNAVYSQNFNRRHRRAGHLLQGRYKAILVEKESYLLELCRYIVRNPVAAKMVDDPAAWKWSSYRATAGIGPAPGFLTTEWILGQFGNDPQGARQSYVTFVHDEVKSPSPWKSLRGGILLGEDSFVERFRGESEVFDGTGEVPKAQRLAHRPSLEEVFAGRGSREEQSFAAYVAHVEWNYQLKEIGNYLGRHYATISKMIKGVTS